MASTPNVVQNDIAWVRCGPERKSFSAAPKIHPHRTKAHTTLKSIASPHKIHHRPQITAHTPPHAEPNVILGGPKDMLRSSQSHAKQNPWSFRVESEVKHLNVVLHKIQLQHFWLCRAHFAGCA